MNSGSNELKFTRDTLTEGFELIFDNLNSNERPSNNTG